MRYEFAAAADYSDYASGSVLRSAPGHPGFPVRLGSELFQRAVRLIEPRTGLSVWDPCCGSGQLITTLGLLHPDLIGRVVVSDIDPHVLPLAEKNLSLLTPAGLAARRAELTDLAGRFGKGSHASAVASASQLAAGLGDRGPEVRVRRASLFDPPSLAAMTEGANIDIVITDLPYGQQTELTGSPGQDDDFDRLLANLAGALPPDAVIVLVVSGRRMPSTGHPALATMRAGTRAVGFYSASIAKSRGWGG